MDWPRKVVDRTWIATALFLVVSAAVWWTWLGIGAAAEFVVAVLLVTPPVWWVLVGRGATVRLGRGLLAGVLIGPLSQVGLALIQSLWHAMSHGKSHGEGGIVSLGAGLFYTLVGIMAVPIGALAGLLAAALQRRWARSRGD